ncbi:hypothetical protein ABT099_23775 [Streptomyces prasinus]
MTTTPEPAPTAATETTPRRIPAWVTDPNLTADILAGHTDIDDDLMGEA